MAKHRSCDRVWITTDDCTAFICALPISWVDVNFKSTEGRAVSPGRERDIIGRVDRVAHFCRVSSLLRISWDRLEAVGVFSRRPNVLFCLGWVFLIACGLRGCCLLDVSD